MNYRLSEQNILNQAHEFCDRLPDKVADLYDLDTLQIKSTSGITTFEPLKNFHNLRHLRFGTTDATMTISTLYGIEAAANLQSLTFMSRTKINDGVEAVSHISTLSSLGLYNVHMPLPADFLRSMNNLRLVSLSAANYESISYLPPHLEELYLNFDSITSLPAWNVVSSLKKLELGGQRCCLDTLDSLSIFPGLEELTVMSPKQLVSIAGAAKLKKLRELNLNYAVSVTDFSPLAHLPALEVLRLRGTSIKKLQDIQPLPGLKKLFVEKSRLADITGIRDFLPALEVLWMWQTKVKNLDPLADMQNLRELNVAEQKYGNWDFLRTLKKLEKIDIYRSACTDLSYLADLPCLTYIRCGADCIVPPQLRAETGLAGWDY